MTDTLFDGPARMDAARAAAAEDELREARARRDHALARVEHAAARPWVDRAWDFLCAYLRSNREMFVDDLWAAGLPHTREDRALGALFQRAARAKYMVKSGSYRKSIRSNLTEKPVWKSLIYGTETP